MKKHLLLLSIIFLALKGFATCPTGYSEVIVKIIPDQNPQETSWTISTEFGIVVAQNDTARGDTVCLSNDTCYIFNIFDSYADGITTPGGFWLYSNGNLIQNNQLFGSSFQVVINGLAGSYCPTAMPISFGSYTANFDNTWYKYTPVNSGYYSLNTCSLNTCDTKIWVYTGCPLIPYNENVPGTYAFNDNNCNTQAELNVFLLAGTTYYFRIGDNMDQCTVPVNFTFSYVGPVHGCTDIHACNYNPTATVDDSSCIYYPNPGCSGPDLQFDSIQFLNSIRLDSVTASTCDVSEGCLLGYGMRKVLRFTSQINNIGTLDFFIGNPNTQPSMFNTNNCHGHAHYEGYGDYRLYDSSNNLIPAGHKNGFCVEDLCGTISQFNCSNMGISVGCYDAYVAGTQCQWIDITDVPDGDYRLAILINSKHFPDALGRFETNYANNTMQVCLHIVHHAGVPSYSLLPNCTPFVDCMGVPGGASVTDCNGLCGGPAIYGDMFQDNILNSQDVSTYLDILQSNLPASTCNDLSGDNNLTIYDDALLNWCLQGYNSVPGINNHSHCSFPRNVNNPNDLVGLEISNVDLTNNYVDVSILNPVCNVKAYQFTISGIAINNVVSLADPIQFPVDVRYKSSTNSVFAISLEDSTLNRMNVPQQLVRIYFSAITDTQICISAITDIVNQNAERTVTNVLGNCFQSQITSVPSIIKQADLVVIPDPAKDRAFIHLSEKEGNIRDLRIIDVSGKSFSIPKRMMGDSWYELDLNDLPPGVYIVSMMNDSYYGVTRFVKL